MKVSVQKKVPFFGILIAAVIIAAVSACIFFIYTLVLRTDYKAAAFEINEAFRTQSSVLLIQGEDSFSMDPYDAEFYNKFLLNNTAVFSRKSVPENEDTIILRFQNETLSFTNAGDGTAIAIRWQNGSEEKHYIVRSQTTFMQLSAYYMNCRRKAA